jgi:meso-butanediol dehydrogenase/(S,S)-butanediol dehydrogenase/diacetyl reductase
MVAGLSGMTAVVTGAGSGIGLGIALRFVQEGCDVLAVDKSGDGLEKAASAARGAGGRLRTLLQDVTADDAPAGILGSCRAQLAAPQILVNNAGVGSARAADETTDTDLDRYLSLNLRSVFRLSRDFVRQIRDSDASIINIASAFGLIGYPGNAPYAATKAGVIGLTRQMACDYGPRRIRVNAIAPGLIATPATASRIANSVYLQKTVIDASPLGRAGSVEDIAAAAVFLASREASFITGHVLAVDGGWTTTRYWPQ